MIVLTVRFSLLRLYSLQRRRECYCIIYVWKIIVDLVTNFSKPIVCTHSEHRGRYCVVSHVNIHRYIVSQSTNHIRTFSMCLDKINYSAPKKIKNNGYISANQRFFSTFLSKITKYNRVIRSLGRSIARP